MKWPLMILLYSLCVLSCDDKNIDRSEKLTTSAEKLTKQKKWVAAQKLLLQAIELNKNNKDAYNDLAICRLKQGAPFDSVVYYFNIAKSIDSLYAIPDLNLADYYLQRRENQKALDHAVLAIKRLDSTDDKERVMLSAAYDIAGHTLNNTGQYATAMMCLQKAIRFDPNNMRACEDIGHSYLMSKDYSKGIRFLTIIIEDDTMDVAAYENRGLCYAYSGQYDLAMNDENKAISILPDSSSGYHYRGLLYKEMGNNKKAREDLKKAVALGSRFAQEDLDSLKK